MHRSDVFWRGWLFRGLFALLEARDDSLNIFLVGFRRKKPHY
jgi:hypothetical protein